VRDKQILCPKYVSYRFRGDVDRQVMRIEENYVGPLLEITTVTIEIIEFDVVH
jgi:hypothetical protein